jgi:polysaccharide pyruvyl transferase WcaK-like protein
MGVPVVAISYFGPKAPGIMEMVGLQDYVMDIGEITFEEASSKLDNLIKNRSDVSSLIKDRVKQLCNAAGEIPFLFSHAT